MMERQCGTCLNWRAGHRNRSVSGAWKAPADDRTTAGAEAVVRKGQCYGVMPSSGSIQTAFPRTFENDRCPLWRHDSPRQNDQGIPT